MDLDFKVFFVGDASVLSEHDSTTVLKIAVSDELVYIWFRNIFTFVVFVFNEYFWFVLSDEEDISSFFLFISNVVNLGGRIERKEDILDDVFGDVSLGGAFFKLFEYFGYVILEGSLGGAVFSEFFGE